MPSHHNATEFSVRQTNVPGLLEFDIPVYEDQRGWFKEAFSRKTMDEIGALAGFTVLQANISYNENTGTTRGIHAEPSDKYITPVSGSIFAAIVDLRDGDEFGAVESFILDVSSALYVPRGCGNSYQALEDHTSYSYLVNGLWSPNDTYTMVDLADKTLVIDWPIPLDQAVISDKDKSPPPFDQVKPITPLVKEQ